MSLSTEGSALDSTSRFQEVPIAGVRFAATTLSTASDWLVQTATSRTADRRPTPVRLSNAYCTALASTSDEYKSVLNGVGVTFPDGFPVAWLMRRKLRAQGNSASQIRGYDLFLHTLEAGLARDIRHFFLGTTPEVLLQLRSVLDRNYPGIAIVGDYAPPFTPHIGEWLSEAVAKIRATGPDIIWVGLGTPKQDFAAVELAKSTNLPIVGIGAVFNFVAGTVKQAPEIMQRTGLEWLFRLAVEPRRLWRRYLFGNLRFLVAVYRHRL